MSAAHNQEGEWIAWEGGECPVPAETPIEVRFRVGLPTPCDDPHHLRWSHLKSDAHRGTGDIIAYRVVRP